MSLTVSKTASRHTAARRSALGARQVLSVRCMAMPDAKVAVRQVLLSAGVLATALSLTMSAQAFDLGSKVQSAADTVQTSIKGTVTKVQSSASQAGDKVGTSLAGSEPLPSDLTGVRKDIDSKVREATSKLGEALTSETPFAESKVPKSVDAANAANAPSPGVKTI